MVLANVFLVFGCIKYVMTLLDIIRYDAAD